MQILSVNGVVYIYMYIEDKAILKPSYFQNKVFLKTTPTNGEIWVYNYNTPNLLIGGQTYFGAKAKREFYSKNKEDIFEELGLIEREEGIFAFESYTQGKSLRGVLATINSSFNGLVQLGDKIGQAKIKAMNYDYDILNNISGGVYDF